MEDYNLVKKLLKKIEEPKTYYEILGITAEWVTDSIVEEAYKDKMKQAESMLKTFKGADSKDIELLKDRIETAFNDAYSALKSEHSRKNYEELLKFVNSEKKLDEDSSSDELER